MAELTYDKSYVVAIRKKIAEKSINTECSVVATLWMNPELYHEYSSDLSENMFKSNVWRTYYTIGLEMAKKGFKNIDEVSVATYLDDKNELKDTFYNLGGFSKIEIALEMVSEDNFEAHLGTLKKASSLFDYVSGLSMTETGIEKLMSFDSVEDIYSFLTIKLNDIFKTSSMAGSRSGSLVDDLDNLIEEADKGLNRGIPFNSPILSDEVGGICLGQIMLVGGLSGTGKTTFTQELHLSAMWEREESTVCILNEQPKEKWQQQFLVWIINNKILPKDSNEKFTSKRWRDGHFTEREKELLYTAKKMLKEKIKDNLIIIEELESYSQKNAEKIIKRYAHLGIKYFVLDTFKVSSDHKGDMFWFSMQEDARKFDDLVKPTNLNVNLWVTLQLEKGAVFKRYLTGANIGMSKNVLDVASVSLLMRSVRNDEFAGGKNELKVIKPFSKECKGSGEEVFLNPNKHYVIIFIEKNRNGESQTYQIVAENALGTLEYTELGITNVAFDT